MAQLKGKKISALTELGLATDTTIIPVVDGLVPTTKYIKASNLSRNITIETDQELDAFYGGTRFATLKTANLDVAHKAVLGSDSLLELHTYSVGDTVIFDQEYIQEVKLDNDVIYRRKLKFYPASGGPGGPTPAGIYPEGTFEKVETPQSFLSDSFINIPITDLDSMTTPGSYAVTLSSGSINGFTLFNLLVEDINPAPGSVADYKQTASFTNGTTAYRLYHSAPVIPDGFEWGNWTAPVVYIDSVNCSTYENYSINKGENFFSVRSRGLVHNTVNLTLPLASESAGREIKFFFELGGLGNILGDMISAQGSDTIILKNSANGTYSEVTYVDMNHTPGGFQYDPMTNRSFISLISDGYNWLEV
jgi:hypothetical protein